MIKLLKTTLATFFISMACIATTYAANNAQYTIVIDAGSNGSRLYLFAYEPAEVVPVISVAFSSSVAPGVSSYVDHPETAGDAVKKILDDAAAYMSDHGIDESKVPVSLLATAGMRLVPEDKQQAVYQTIRTFMQAHYAFPVQDVKTISGQMEALYGWLDVNYLLGTFQRHERTFGSADVGGASAEIAFATNDTSFDPADVVNVTINQQTYPVYAVSFLGLGQDQIRDAMNHSESAAACYPPQYQLNDKTTGQFDLPTCGNQLQNLIQYKMDKILPETHGSSFVAYSGIYYDYTFFNADNRPSRVTLEEHINNICHQNWPDLKAKFPNVPEKYLSADCANGVFIDKLIYSDYHLSDDELKITNQINTVTIDWTLGAALYSLLPH